MKKYTLRIISILTIIVLFSVFHFSGKANPITNLYKISYENKTYKDSYEELSIRNFRLETDNLDNLYCNTAGGVTFDVYYAYSADLDVTVYHNGVDVTSWFNMSGPNQINDVAYRISLIKKNEMMNEFTAGTYEIRVVDLGGVLTQTFDMQDEYSNFYASVSACDNVGDNCPANMENTWVVTIQQRFNVFFSDINTRIYNNSGTDVTSLFNIVQGNDDKIYITNRVTRDLKPGNYRVNISYVRWPIRQVNLNLNIIVGPKKIGVNLLDSNTYRYTMVDEVFPFTIKVSKIVADESDTNNDLIYYRYDDEAETSKTRSEFTELYPNINLGSVNTYNSLVVLNHDNEVIITNVYPTTEKIKYLTNVSDEGEELENYIEKEVSYADFETNHQDLYNELFDGSYEFVNNKLIKILTDSYTVTRKQTLRTNNGMLAGAGGELKLTYKTTGIPSDVITNDKYEYVINNITNGSDLSNDENFSIELINKSCNVVNNVDECTFTIYLKFTNGSEDLANVYAGNYNLYLIFEDTDRIPIPFNIESGEMDYYVTGMVNKHDESEDPLNEDVPPANKKYEYEIGLFLVKGGIRIDNVDLNSNITTNIYEHAVGCDNNCENLSDRYYYDALDYVITINSINNNSINYDITINGETNRSINKTLTEFKNTYKDAGDLLNHYTFNNNTIDSSDFNYQIISFKKSDTTEDMIVTYKDSGDNILTDSLNDFKYVDSDLYFYLINNFSFDDNGNFLTNTIRGVYEDRSKYVGQTVTDISNLFNIERNTTDTNASKVLTITPKTEINGGEYYVYTTYGTHEAIGFVNNSEGSVISKDLYPDMWNRNTHMVILKYDDPLYDFKYNGVEYSNNVNEESKNYFNINGSAKFSFDGLYIYDYSKLRFTVDYYDEDNSTWINNVNYFRIENGFINEEVNDITSANVILNNIIGTTKQGKYRLNVIYNNNGGEYYNSFEFNVSGKYYDFITRENNLGFVHNDNEVKYLKTNALYVSNPENIDFDIVREVDGVELVSYHYDKTNHNFKDDDGNVIFELTTDYSSLDADTLDYIISLNNIADYTREGTYKLRLKYQESGSELLIKDYEFVVTSDRYEYHVLNPRAKVVSGVKILEADITTDYIKYETLNTDFEYKVVYYDNSTHQFIDVSSNNAAIKMFDIRTSWEEETGRSHKGKLFIALDDTKVDYNKVYQLSVSYRGLTTVYELPDMKDSFSWTVNNYEIKGSIHDDVLDQDINVNGYYNNISNTTIDVNISLLHDDNVKWVINKSCLNNTCVPSSGTNYNHLFNVVNTTSVDGNLKLSLKDNLNEEELLPTGEYALVLYYSDEDYNIVKFNVYDKYVSIILDKDHAIYYSKITNEVNKDNLLFSNKDGFIHMPILVYGVPYSDVSVTITDINGVNDYISYFDINNDKLSNDRTLEVKYIKERNIPAGNYLITVYYRTEDGLVSDSFDFEIKDYYFDFTLNEPITNPTYLIPNSELGGNIKIKIDTEEIPYLTMGINNIEALANKYQFVNNTKILNSRGIDVTNAFSISVENVENEPDSINLVITYENNAITPDDYIIVTGFNGVYKDKSITVYDYMKEFYISSIETFSNVPDGKVHNNFNGRYRVNYQANYDYHVGDIKVNIYNSSDVDVTDRFGVSVYSGYVMIDYVAGDNYLPSGNYKVELSYKEDEYHEITSTSEYIEMGMSYKDIVISNIISSDNVIYGDKDNQYYTFNVDKNVLTNDEINNLVVKVRDEDGNLVYSSIQDEVTNNLFSSSNELLTNDYIKLDILKNKAMVGNYYVSVYVYEGELFNQSNELKFTVDDTLYKVNITNYSVQPNKNYGDNLIYDRDGFKGHIEFNTDANYESLNDVALVLYKGVTKVRNLDSNYVEENGNISADFNMGNLVNGEYKIYVSVNGLPYTYKTVVVNKYINTTNIDAYIGQSRITDNFVLYDGSNNYVALISNPSNATDKAITLSSDNGIITFSNNIMMVRGIGEANITIKNQDYEKNIRVICKAKLSSNRYEVNNSNNLIYVSSMTAKSLSVNEFVSNLTGVISGYRVMNAKGSDITGGGVVTTGSTIINGSERYRIVIIGDLNQDGNINVYDVAMLFQHVRNKKRITDAYSFKAADIRKVNDIRVYDVSKLFQFVRGKIGSL